MRKMESIIKWSGSITCKLVQRHKRQTPHSECSLPRLSAFLFSGHESRGGKLEWMPSPIFKSDGFFLLSQPFYLHRAPLFDSQRHDGRAPRRKEDFLFPGFIENRWLVLLHDRTNSATRQSGRNHRECSHFSEHIRFPLIAVIFLGLF